MPPAPDEPPSRALDRRLAADTPTEEASPDDAPTAMLLAGETASIFRRDEVVASRYRVVRFIARGGMGEVYEVFDVELGVMVALKTVRPDHGGGSHPAERFKREIHLARQVTHPHVCRIFDLVRHTRTAGPEADPEVLCLTMDLLSGETLLHRLRRGGTMSTAEAQPIVEQLASALAAAGSASDDVTVTSDHGHARVHGPLGARRLLPTWRNSTRSPAPTTSSTAGHAGS
jgi:eukaryotic-like serine/threonine-protein kinase